MKNYNMVTITGKLFDATAEEIISKNGTEFLKGKLTLNVDGDMIDVDAFASETFPNGSANPVWTMLKEIRDGDAKTESNSGNDAIWVSTSGAIDVSYFVPQNSDDGAAMRAQKIPSRPKTPRARKFENKWKADTLITEIVHEEADLERGTPEMVKVFGYIVQSKNVQEGGRWERIPQKLVRVQFTALSQGAMDYIKMLSVSEDNPYFVSTWGKIGFTNRQVESKSAFGESETVEYKTLLWEITGMSSDPYDFGDENSMTQEEYKELREALSAHVAELVGEVETSGDDLAF